MTPDDRARALRALRCGHCGDCLQVGRGACLLAEQRLAAIEAAGLAVVDRERLARLERLERARDARFRPETTIVEDDDD